MSKLGNLGDNKSAYADGDGGLIIETKVDLSDFAEYTKEQYNSNSGKTGWGEQLYDPKNKIATLPTAIIEELNRKGLMRGYYILDQAALKKWLNDPENRVFRTRGGIV